MAGAGAVLFDSALQPRASDDVLGALCSAASSARSKKRPMRLLRSATGEVDDCIRARGVFGEPLVTVVTLVDTFNSFDPSSPADCLTPSRTPSSSSFERVLRGSSACASSLGLFDARDTAIASSSSSSSQNTRSSECVPLSSPYFFHRSKTASSGRSGPGKKDNGHAWAH